MHVIVITNIIVILILVVMIIMIIMIIMITVPPSPTDSKRRGGGRPPDVRTASLHPMFICAKIDTPFGTSMLALKLVLIYCTWVAIGMHPSETVVVLGPRTWEGTFNLLSMSLPV